MNDEILTRVQIDIAKLTAEFQAFRSDVQEGLKRMDEKLACVAELQRTQAACKATQVERHMTNKDEHAAIHLRLTTLNGRTWNTALKVAGFGGGAAGLTALAMKLIELLNK